MYICYAKKCIFVRYEYMVIHCGLSIVDFVLTSINSEFTGVNMEIATRDLSVIIRARAQVVTVRRGREKRLQRIA